LYIIGLEKRPEYLRFFIKALTGRPKKFEKMTVPNGNYKKDFYVYCGGIIKTLILQLKELS